MSLPTTSPSCGYARKGVGWRNSAIRARAARASSNVMGHSVAAGVETSVISKSPRECARDEQRRERDDDGPRHQLEGRASVEPERRFVAPLRPGDEKPVIQPEQEDAQHEDRLAEQQVAVRRGP